ncbi:Trk system potassium uptake protein TrkH [Gammaproteobacteria bacterium]
MRFPNLLYLTGMLSMIFSVSMLPPIIVGEWYGDGEVLSFARAFVILFGIGLLCRSLASGHKPDLSRRDGLLILPLFWLLFSALGALPLMLSEQLQMAPVDAFFESVSGLTTTGASVISRVDHLSHAVNYYRHQLCFIGGMGIVLMGVALVPVIGIGGMQLYRAETPGPMKEGKLIIRFIETTKHLWYLYVGLNLACALAFWGAGMGPFDAVCHAFSTLSLGGFSTHDASIGYYHSGAIEIVAGFFTLVAGVNFALHFLAWRGRSIRAYVNDPEFILYAWIMGVIIVLTFVILWSAGTFPFWKALYHAFFQGPSIVANNGLVTRGYPTDWPALAPLLLLSGSFVGGCAGSTGGGIKVIRLLLLYKFSMREARILIHPSAHLAIKFGDRLVDDRVANAVWGFYFLYIFSYGVFSLALVATGLDLVTSFGSVGGCINNTGVGLGATATGFGSINDTAKWLLAITMLMGRLEIFPVLLLFLPKFWRR